MAKLVFHGHSCWEVQGEKHRVLIDPFLTGNPIAKIGPDHFDRLNAILVTHGHGDHLGDVEAIAKKTGALVVSINEVALYFGAKGLEVHTMHIGGGRKFEFGHVKFTIAHHGSMLPDGTYGGVAVGVIADFGGKRVYFTGDTALTLDMQLVMDLALVGMSLAVGVRIYRGYQARRHDRQHVVCRGCGHELAGTTVTQGLGTCPECGAPFAKIA